MRRGDQGELPPSAGVHAGDQQQAHDVPCRAGLGKMQELESTASMLTFLHAQSIYLLYHPGPPLRVPASDKLHVPNDSRAPRHQQIQLHHRSQHRDLTTYDLLSSAASAHYATAAVARRGCAASD